MTLSIRMITDDDLDQVTDMWDEHVMEVGGAAFDPDTRMRIFGGLCRCLPALMSVCFVADWDGKAAGFIVGTVSDGSAGDVEELYVKPAYRRKKIAAALVSYLSEWMRSKGASVLRPQTAIDTVESRAFWKSISWDGDTLTFNDYSDDKPES